MEVRSVDGCGVVDGIMGMGLAQEGDRQSAFEDLVEVGVKGRASQAIDETMCPRVLVRLDCVASDRSITGSRSRYIKLLCSPSWLFFGG